MAGTAERVLAIKLIGDVADINKSLKKTEGRLKGMARSGLQWGKAFTAALAIEGVEKLGEAIGDAWTGFREGEKASAQLATTWGNLGKDGADLAGIIDQIGESTLKLGTDDVEAINAFNQALKTTGGDSAKAMQRLRIAQDLVANGSAPNLASALSIIQGAAKGSARTVDKFGLTADTAGGRVRQLGRRVRGAAKAAADADPMRVFFNEIAEALEGIVGSIAQGDLEGAIASLAGIGDALATAWSKVGPGITGVFDKLSGGAFSDVMTKLRELGDTVGPKVAGAIGAMAAAWVPLQAHLANALTFIQPVIDLLSGSVAGGLAFVLDAVTGALQLVADLMNGDFSAAFTTITETVGKLGTDLNDFFVGLPGKLVEWAIEIATEASLLGKGISDAIILWAHTTLLTDLVGFFTGLPGKLLDWAVAIGAAAVNIGTSIFNGIAGGVNDVVGVVRGVVNKVIGALNSINNFSWGRTGFEVNTLFGNAFVGVGAASIQLWPDIPYMAKGGIVNSPTLAMIGEAGPEAVVPLGSGGGMGGINVYVTVGPTADLAGVGREITKALKAYKNGGGGPAMRSAIGA